MKIMVTGLRGIPGIQGGIETHAEHLYPLLVKQGCEVEIIARSSSIPSDHPHTWNNIKIKQLWSPKTSGLESFIHTFIAILYAAIKRPDILHIHAIGPAIMTPLARIFGLRVIVTHHGPDYDREKWGQFAKNILLTGEKFGMKYSNERIVISKVIQQLIQKKYKTNSVLIPNGITISDFPDSQSTLDEFKVIPEKYILQVSRIVPEKRQIDLLQAFIAANIPGWKLVLVGEINKNETYTKKLIELGNNNNNIVFTDFKKGLALKELLAHAGMFVLPSSHEGLPIALLEALSYGLPVIASDIPANLEINLPEGQYFPLGNINKLTQKLQDFAKIPLNMDKKEKIREWVKEKYNWTTIADKTFSTYQNMMKN